MRRIVALAALAVLVVVAATIADYPGSVDITWQGWQIDTSVGVLIAALAVLGLVLWLLVALVGAVIGLPQRFRRNRRERRRRLGELALTRGMVALAAGDKAAARRQSQRAETLLGPTPLTLMLAAQAAQLDGDEAGARQRYTVLLDQKEGAFFGLRGLIGQAQRAGDATRARQLAQRAYSASPASWSAETLLALQAREQDWDATLATLADATRRRLLPAPRARHHRGALLYEQSLAAERDGDRQRAATLAAEANGLLPNIAAAAARHARLQIADGRPRPARRIVEQAWRTAPHPDLAAVWAELGGGVAALELVPWFEKLAAQAPCAAESAIAVAEAAMAAQLWGEARRHLTQAIAAETGAPRRRLCLLMARLEESEHPSEPGAREWLDRALAAPPDPAWCCAHCGGENAEWRALCAHCRGFDTLSWRRPAASLSVLAPTPPEITATAPLLPMPDGLAAARQSVR